MKLFPRIIARRLNRQLEVTFRPVKRVRLEEVPENWHENFIVHLASILRPRVYVELGLYKCEVFNRIVPYADRLIGVDINPETSSFMDTASGKTTFFHGTTIAFAESLKDNQLSIDLLFVDADHSEEAVMTDFKKFFPYISDHGIVLFHDAHPKNLDYTQPQFCGDGYKAIEELSKRAEIYEMMTIPVHPGLAICRKRARQLRWE